MGLSRDEVARIADIHSAAARMRVAAAKRALAKLVLAHAAGDERRAVALLDAIVATGADASVRMAAEALRERMGSMAPRSLQ